MELEVTSDRKQNACGDLFVNDHLDELVSRETFCEKLLETRI